MKLLIEKSPDFESFCITEEVISEGSGQRSYYIKGPFLQSEVKNHNKRIYPRDIMAKEVNRYTEAKIKDNQAVR